MNPLALNGEGLEVDGVLEVANGRSVSLEPEVIPLIKRSRAAVDELARH